MGSFFFSSRESSSDEGGPRSSGRNTALEHGGSRIQGRRRAGGCAAAAECNSRSRVRLATKDAGDCPVLACLCAQVCFLKRRMHISAVARLCAKRLRVCARVHPKVADACLRRGERRCAKTFAWSSVHSVRREPCSQHLLRIPWLLRAIGLHAMQENPLVV